MTAPVMVMLPPCPPVNHWIKAYFGDENGPADIRWEPLIKEPWNWRCISGIRRGITEDWAEIVCAAIRYGWVLRHGE